MRRDECKCIHESGGDTMYRRLKHMCVYETREWEFSLIRGRASASFYAETWQSQRTANIRQFTAHVAINSASLSPAVSRISKSRRVSSHWPATRRCTLPLCSLRVSLVYIILTPCTAASARLRPPQPQLIVHLLYIYGRTVQTTFYLSFCVPRYTSKICRDTSCTGPAGHSPCNRGETVPRKV